MTSPMSKTSAVSPEQRSRWRRPSLLRKRLLNVLSVNVLPKKRLPLPMLNSRDSPLNWIASRRTRTLLKLKPKWSVKRSRVSGLKLQSATSRRVRSHRRLLNAKPLSRLSVSDLPQIA